MSHIHNTQLQNASCVPAITSVSLFKGSSYSESVMCTYKGNTLPFSSCSTWCKCATRNVLQSKWSVTSPVHGEEGTTTKGIKNSTTRRASGGKCHICSTTESRFLCKSTWGLNFVPPVSSISTDKKEWESVSSSSCYWDMSHALLRLELCNTHVSPWVAFTTN